MKAFMIRYPVDDDAAVDLSYDYNLPRVECLECTPDWKYWGDGDFEYPAFDFEFLNPEEFPFRRVVSVAEFGRYQERIARAAGRRVTIIPGASIGRLSGTASKSQ